MASAASTGGILLGTADGLRLVADALPPRTSLRQALAILEVMAAHFDNRSITMSDLRESASERTSAAEIKTVGQSIAKTFEVFYEATKAKPGGLGWVFQETDESDRRIKYLKLTKLGVERATEVANKVNARTKAA